MPGSDTRHDAQSRPRLQPAWINILCLATAHLVAAGTVVYLITVRSSGWTLLLGTAWFMLCGLAISGGYHRLFAHRTYRAAWPLRLFYLLFGAAAAQNSALKWSSDHRIHHAHTDEARDPYNITRGFWWAHIGWVMFHDPAHETTPDAPDLSADPLVAFQHKYYVVLAILVGALIPAALGALWGDALGALLVVGFLRLVLQWHATFTINSVAHWIGRRPYCKTTSARDSHLTALISLGEGYHNFHHRFQSDYRNGVRWFHFDPTKWFVWSLERVGVTRDLKRTPQDAVRRAREAMLRGGA